MVAGLGKSRQVGHDRQSCNSGHWQLGRPRRAILEFRLVARQAILESRLLASGLGRSRQGGHDRKSRNAKVPDRKRCLGNKNTRFLKHCSQKPIKTQGFCHICAVPHPGSLSKLYKNTRFLKHCSQQPIRTQGFSHLRAVPHPKT